MIEGTFWQAPTFLASSVHMIWRLRGHALDMQDWLLPHTGGADIAIQFGQPHDIKLHGEWRPMPVRAVVGGLIRGVPLRHRGEVDTIGITLAPGNADLLGVNARALLGHMSELRAVAPLLDQRIACWMDAMQSGCATLYDLLTALAVFVSPRSDRLVVHAARKLSHTVSSIDSLAEELAISHRQLQRRFVTVTGITPREFKRRTRFATAWQLASIRPVTNWSDLAATTGYFDHSHLVRDFQHYMGTPPSEVFNASWYGSAISDVRTVQDTSSPPR